MKNIHTSQELIIKYFYNRHPKFEDNFIQVKEEKFHFLIPMLCRDLLGKLCEEFGIDSIQQEALYYYGLSQKLQLPFFEAMNDSFKDFSEKEMELTNATLWVSQLHKSPCAKEIKMQLSYMEKGVLHSAIITDMNIINHVKIILTDEFEDMDCTISMNKEKLNDQYLINKRDELQKRKTKKRRPATTNFLYVKIIKLKRFIQEETLLKSEAKTISNAQGEFIHRFLKIFGLLVDQRDSKYEGIDYIRSIIDNHQNAKHIKLD